MRGEHTGYLVLRSALPSQQMTNALRSIARALRSVLFSVSATDPLILTASIGTILLLSLVACAVPAQRAASTDSVHALWAE